jgi:glycosyltransferase involved in cell wall biosynthesis
MRAAAIICLRNEEVHVEPLIEDLVAEGLDVVLLDNESTDATVELAQPFLGRGLLTIERKPWIGCFSMDQVLEATQRVATTLDHDWVLHLGADEWPSSPDEGKTLLEGLVEAEAAGANCVNFDEFVFLPRPGEDMRGRDYRRLVTRYYFLQPYSPRLMRAWRRGAGLDNRRYGGHEVTGGARLYARNFPLRHYVVLSADHARAKYLDRVISQAELDRGWHAGREMQSEDLELPGDDPRIRTLPHWSSKAFDRTMPCRSHYWNWAREGPVRCERLSNRARRWVRRRLITRYEIVPASAEAGR